METVNFLRLHLISLPRRLVIIVGAVKRVFTFPEVSCRLLCHYLLRSLQIGSVLDEHCITSYKHWIC